MTARPVPDPQDLFGFAAWLVTGQGRAFVDGLPDTVTEETAVGQTAVSGSALVVREPERAVSSLTVLASEGGNDDVVQAGSSPQRDVFVGRVRSAPGDLESSGWRAAGMAHHGEATAPDRLDVAGVTAFEPRPGAVGERGDVAGVASGEPQNASLAADRKVGAVTVLANYRKQAKP